MSVSKRIRFEVFKRDGFVCAYCGRTPPNVLLECDHMEPVIDGGSDDINNLITACFDCNRGKAHVPLTVVPQQLIDNLNIIKERETQLAEYNSILSQIDMRIGEDSQVIYESFMAYTGRGLSGKFWDGSLRTFLKRLPAVSVIDAMATACDMMPHDDPERVVRYFCGICWNRIKGGNPCA